MYNQGENDPYETAYNVALRGEGPVNFYSLRDINALQREIISETLSKKSNNELPNDIFEDISEENQRIVINNFSRAGGYVKFFLNGERLSCDTQSVRYMAYPDRFVSPQLLTNIEEMKNNGQIYNPAGYSDKGHDWKLNANWVCGAVKANRPIHIRTILTSKMLSRGSGDDEYSALAKEITMARKAGYTYSDNFEFLPPDPPSINPESTREELLTALSVTDVEIIAYIREAQKIFTNYVVIPEHMEAILNTVIQGSSYTDTLTFEQLIHQEPEFIAQLKVQFPILRSFSDEGIKNILINEVKSTLFREMQQMPENRKDEQAIEGHLHKFLSSDAGKSNSVAEYIKQLRCFSPDSVNDTSDNLSPAPPISSEAKTARENIFNAIRNKNQQNASSEQTDEKKFSASAQFGKTYAHEEHKGEKATDLFHPNPNANANPDVTEDKNDVASSSNSTDSSSGCCCIVS